MDIRVTLRVSFNVSTIQSVQYHYIVIYTCSTRITAVYCDMQRKAKSQHKHSRTRWKHSPRGSLFISFCLLFSHSLAHTLLCFSQFLPTNPRTDYSIDGFEWMNALIHHSTENNNKPTESDTSTDWLTDSLLWRWMTAATTTTTVSYFRYEIFDCSLTHSLAQEEIRFCVYEHQRGGEMCGVRHTSQDVNLSIIPIPSTPSPPAQSLHIIHILHLQ